MKRRHAIAVPIACCAVGVPITGLPQGRSGAVPYRIALLSDFIAPESPFARQFVAVLGEMGHIEGRDYILSRYAAISVQDYAVSAKRAVDEGPDLIFAGNTAYALAAQRLTQSIPIVMWTSGFPVEAGVADSLARPGRNVTGMSGYAGTGVLGKFLQLLRDAKPGIKRVAWLRTYVPPYFPRSEIEPSNAEIHDAARRLELDVRIMEIGRPDQVDATLAAIVPERRDSLVLTSGAPMQSQRQKVVDFAIQNRLPTVADSHWTEIERRPLLSYGPHYGAMFRQATIYVERILWGGAKAGELPIQLPSRFQFVVNLKTAKALGITIPQSLLLRADEVIQ